ncbi:unnamed protein product [Prorocentrum cordatum]|uniref:Uncharacterized protein n=1 Tax=Prorocentrum cordatum TaxID=2364126 RepID=A0ABN9W988_9DINO|nr:unnamed protein product [Polarella glacialis]
MLAAERIVEMKQPLAKEGWCSFWAEGHRAGAGWSAGVAALVRGAWARGSPAEWADWPVRILSIYICLKDPDVVALSSNYWRDSWKQPCLRVSTRVRFPFSPWHLRRWALLEVLRLLRCVFRAPACRG